MAEETGRKFSSIFHFHRIKNVVVAGGNKLEELKEEVEVCVLLVYKRKAQPPPPTQQDDGKEILRNRTQFLWPKPIARRRLWIPFLFCRFVLTFRELPLGLEKLIRLFPVILFLLVYLTPRNINTGSWICWSRDITSQIVRSKSQARVTRTSRLGYNEGRPHNTRLTNGNKWVALVVLCSCLLS